MSHQPTVTIGIPAYNEADNILQLLEVLLSQKQEGFVLQEIFVVSDGSTDATVDQARLVKSPLVTVIEHLERRGQQERQNELLRLYRSDVLVLIEADTLPCNERALAELVAPLCNGDPTIGMTVGQAIPLGEPRTVYEKILWHNNEIRHWIFNDWKDGINIYTSGGHAMRALNRSFTSQLKWSSDVPEDAYAYLLLKSLSLSMVRCFNAQTYMRNVVNFSDRYKQVTKFLSGKAALMRHFPEETVRSEYFPPVTLVARHLMRSFIRWPFWTIMVILEVIFNRLATVNYPLFDALSTPHRSSKKLGVVSPAAYFSVMAVNYGKEESSVTSKKFNT